MNTLDIVTVVLGKSRSAANRLHSCKIRMWAGCGVSNTIILARLNFLESGHIKVDQMRKQYDFRIKGAKVFAACNQISRQTDWPAPAANLFLQWWVADGT